MVSLQDDFGVAIGKEAIALGAQLLAKLLEIVDAAIEHDAQPKPGVEHRLL
jgi:hypothetical protein